MVSSKMIEWKVYCNGDETTASVVRVSISRNCDVDVCKLKILAVLLGIFFVTVEITAVATTLLVLVSQHCCVDIDDDGLIMMTGE